MGRAVWRELLGRLPRSRGTGRPATQTGQLPPLTRVRFLHSCRGARAERGQAGTSPRAPAQPCHEHRNTQRSHRLPCACDRAGPRPCPLHACSRRRSPGTPTTERIFMLSPGIDISVDQSNISQVFFLLATGMRSFGLGVLDVEKLLLGGGHAAVPGARAVAPLDASVVLRLPPIHVVLLHRPVCPETLVRGGDEAGDGEAARDLRTTETVTDRPERGTPGQEEGVWGGGGWWSSSGPGMLGCPIPVGYGGDATPRWGD